MVFDAHERAFCLFGGSCRHGIYDKMMTAVAAIFVGRQHLQPPLPPDVLAPFRRDTRLQSLCGLGEGGVGNQVRTARGRFFKPIPRFETLVELNRWLEQRCLNWAATAAQMVQRHRMV